MDAIDLSRDPLPPGLAERAQGIALYLPMHTATVLALQLLPRFAKLPARLAAYGLYAPVNADRLRGAGVSTVIGGEFEQGLVQWARGEPMPAISLDRQQFMVPDRAGLPALTRYAQLKGSGPTRAAGYTEATRGCKHLCRHCPIVPVYQGVFRVIQRDVVLADTRQQVAQGAEHITFGDPDFLNGPGHAMALVEALHREFPSVTYDVTIKIEHLLRHRDLLPHLRESGCLFVTSAVESLDDAVLARFAKHHTRANFLEAVALMRAEQLPLNPTFVTFTPWTTRAAYLDLLRTIADLGLIENVAPVQYSIRLLIPAGSLLLDLPEVRGLVGAFDPERLAFPWEHPDAAMDELAQEVAVMAQGQGSRREIFERIWTLAHQRPFDLALPARATVPYLNEPWYC